MMISLALKSFKLRPHFWRATWVLGLLPVAMDLTSAFLCVWRRSPAPATPPRSSPFLFFFFYCSSLLSCALRSTRPRLRLRPRRSLSSLSTWLGLEELGSASRCRNPLGWLKDCAGLDGIMAKCIVVKFNIFIAQCLGCSPKSLYFFIILPSSFSFPSRYPHSVWFPQKQLSAIK